MSSSLEMALDLARRGLSVIPLPRPRPGVSSGAPGDGKVPAIRWAEYQSRKATEAELSVWFEMDQNIAVICGAISGVVAIDCDSAEAVDWFVRRFPRTPWQTRTRRGFHFFYKHPGVSVHNRARINTRDGRLAIDVRGDGGFVVGPGSIHASGHVYEMGGDWSVPRDALPGFWPGWLESPRRPHARRPVGPRPSGDIAARARCYLAAIPRPVIGERSDEATFGSACRLVHGFDLEESTAIRLLEEWCPPDFEREWIERKVWAATKYGSEPVGGLR